MLVPFSSATLRMATHIREPRPRSDVEKQVVAPRSLTSHATRDRHGRIRLVRSRHPPGQRDRRGTTSSRCSSPPSVSHETTGREIGGIRELAQENQKIEQHVQKDCPGKTGQDECSARDNSKEDLAQPSKAINDYMPQHEGGNDEAVLQRMLEGLGRPFRSRRRRAGCAARRRRARSSRGAPPAGGNQDAATRVTRRRHSYC